MKFPFAKNLSLSCKRIAASLLPLALVALSLNAALPLRATDEHVDRVIKQRVAPTYPELAKRMRVSGVVRITAIVAPDGSVTSTKTLSGSPMLSGAAEEAVHKWKWAAAPDATTAEVDVKFAPVQ
jgi:TonB family protein